MRWGGKAVIMAGMVLMAIGGCSRSDVKTVALDGHVFSVPKKYLIQGTIPWLPASQHDGLMFYVNPEAPLRERNSVLIQSTATTCPEGEPLGVTPLAAACHAAAQEMKSRAAEEVVELEKVYSNGDSTPWDGKPTPWWNYRVKDRGGKNQGAIVATCSAMGDGNGLCHSFGNYGDLVYNISLRDSEIQRLPAIRTQVHKLLASWESRGKG
jgi:hypothetical protein